MSVNRTVRPWVPTIIFVAIVLLVIFAINYQTASPYVLGDEDSSSAFLRWAKGPVRPATMPDAHWREALPWPVDPKRFLPNYFTYSELMKELDQLIYRRSDIVFVHVPRSGGTTINTCLSKVAHISKVFDDAMRLVNEKNVETVEDDLRGVNEDNKVIISGEFSFGTCDFLSGRPCSYALMMRDPYERVVSSYHFCQAHDDDKSDFYCSISTNGMSLEQWAILEGSPLFRQLVAHPRSCGDNFENHFDFASMIQVEKGVLKTGRYPCWMKLKAFLEHQLTEEQTAKLVEYVANNIEYWFAVLGTLEEKDSFLTILQDLYYIPVNNVCQDVHKAGHSVLSDPEKQQLITRLKADPDVREALKEDLVLYERVQEAVHFQGKKHWESHKLH